MTATHVRVALHGADVSLLLDSVDGSLPSVAYWGARLGDLSEKEFAAIAAAGVQPSFSNGPDDEAGLSILPEGRTGWRGRPGLSGSRQGADWSPLWKVTSVSLDGAEADGLVAAADGGVVVYTATSEQAKLGLTITVEMLPSGLVRAQAALTNEGEPFEVNELNLAFPLPARAREIMDFAGRWSKERTPQRRPLTVGTHLREGRHGRTGADSAYVYQVGVPGFGFKEGEIWAVHTAWSGNHLHYAERILTGEQVLGGGELLLPGEVVLAQGETYTAPWIYANYADGLDNIARRFHRYLRSRPQHPDTKRPVTLNVWEAVYFDHNAERLIDLAERAAALGVERYVLDDGWFGARRNDFAGLGDWFVSPDVWPNGLHPLIDKVTELDMEFGLWFEPEMINPDSDVARAHPEWIMQTGERAPIESRHQQVINLGIPECFDFIKDSMNKLLDEYAISYIKWDHNRDLVDSGTYPSRKPGGHRQTLAFYRLVDELKAAHPGLEIESCSSGGARIDLEVLQRTDRVWVSDCIDPAERQEMNRWTTQLIPPELMGSHVASGTSHTTGRYHTLTFRAGTALFGHLGIEWDLAKATDEELDGLRTTIAFYKQYRDMLLSGDVVRLDTAEQELFVHGIVAPDKKRAVYSLCSLYRSGETSYGCLQLPGLDPEKNYQVTPAVVGTWPMVAAPGWWHMPEPDWSEGFPPKIDPKRKPTGQVFPGDFLINSGPMTPIMPPDEVVLYIVEEA